ncbi:MAG: M14 family zinc carboxypeptidase [Planctomycetota bacterium]
MAHSSWRLLAACSGVVGVLAVAGPASAQQLVPAAPADAQADVAGPYSGHKLVRLPAASRRVMAAIEDLEADIWTHTIRQMRPIDMRLDPEQFVRFLDLGLEHEVLAEDLQRVVDAERARIAARSMQDDVTWYEEYRTLAEYRDRWAMIAGMNPDLVATGVMGQSLEGRDMPVLHLNGDGRTDKPVLLINACQHAREWVNPAATTFVLEQLVAGYGSDPQITRLLDELEVIIAPMMNPDGFEFSWSDERFWRKNRRDNGDGTFGVDLNRNWNVGWGGPGSSGNTDSQTYRGTDIFSEPELQVFTSYVEGFRDRVVAHLDIHTYGQLILSAWSYKFEPPPDISYYDAVGNAMGDAIFATNQERYTVGQGAGTLYVAGGTAKDYGYGELDALGWTFELRPDSASEGGFDPDPDQIIPTGEELLQAVLVLAEELAQPLRFHLEPQPRRVAIGEAFPQRFEIRDGVDALDPASVVGFFRASADESFVEVGITPLGDEDFAIVLPAMDCEARGEFYVEASTVGGDSYRFPADGAFEQRAAEIVATFEDACESVGGWTAGLPGDDASTGQWALGDPEATTAQPEDDHSPDGVNAWMTDPRAGSSAGSFDVDDGATSLLSPLLDAAPDLGLLDAEAYLTAHFWYSNDKGGGPLNDELLVFLSNDDGTTFEQIDRLRGPTVGWEQKRYRIADFVAPTDQMRLLVIAYDTRTGSLVEAGVDDVSIEIEGCTPHPADLDLDGELTLFDFLLFQNLWEDGDPRADLDGDGAFTLFDFLEFQNLFES